MKDVVIKLIFCFKLKWILVVFFFVIFGRLIEMFGMLIFFLFLSIFGLSIFVISL